MLPHFKLDLHRPEYMKVIQTKIIVISASYADKMTLNQPSLLFS